MATENEPAKLLLPYLQRADELQKHEPLVAYYCRLYAMERGLKIPQSDRTKTTNSLLVSLMKQLEKDKKSLTLGPDDHLHLEGFSLNVFAKADKQDRAGRADLNTAKTFYAASIFFEILNQFGEVQPDLEQKQKYAVWKAADIRKALKEGRKPIPGPPGGDNDLSVPSRTSSGEYDLQPSENEFSDPANRTDLTRTDSAARTTPQSDLSPQIYDSDSFQNSTNFSGPSNYMSSPPPPPPPPPPSYHTDSYTRGDPAARTAPDSDSLPPPYDPDNIQHSSSFSRLPSDSFPQPYDPDNIQHSSSFSRLPSDSFPQPYDPDNIQHSSSFSRLPSNATPSPGIPPPSHYSTDNYPSENVHQPPSHYSHQPYQQEPQPHMPQHYPSQDVPSYSYPHFQSYPSFTDSSLPVAPSNYPSYYQGSDASYTTSSASNTASHASAHQYNSSGRNGNVPEVAPPATEKYEYNSSYQPPPEKIAEAHKAARFAVGSLAFDDVSAAVEYLKKSLDLLTNPSAGH